MKLHIKDPYGTRLMAVFREDGSPAVEGEDYLPWEGVYHKQGKWSFAEGGIAFRGRLWVLINEKSTHYSGDERKVLRRYDGATGEMLNAAFVMGRLGETPARPQCPPNVPPTVWEAAIEVILRQYDLDGQTRKKWEIMERFI